VDDEPDYALPIWAGTLDFPKASPVPNPDPRLQPGLAVPAHVSGYSRLRK
jgi:hypothetical protein